MIRNWIEAMRLRTLPVSVAGVIAGTGCAIMLDSFRMVPALTCLAFAVLAQIAANFGNEYYRVLKPEGRLVILELSVPSDPVIRWCYKLYFLKILPAIGGLVSGDRGAYEYLPASVLRFPPPEQFIQMMKTAGFDTVEHTPFTFGICRMYVGKKSAI